MKRSLSCIMAIDKYKPAIAMLFVQFIYAGMALFSKTAMAKGMNPYVFVAYRQAFGTLTLAPFAFFIESKKAAPISPSLLCKIFLVSLFGVTLTLNLYYYAMNYTTATFAAATTNTVLVVTFVMAFFLRMERISIKQWHGVVKVLGSVLGVSGALVFAFVKGPPLQFMNWYVENKKEIPGPSMKATSNRGRIKGSLVMLSANTAWSL
ncbi:unnamed protein product [Ilex paraguariensis]|uniref:WAT1-related protein n=1 Tax=Ilex paraguariensis TaxID=185542 RepID=A0ABC8QPR8_9AQUA